MSETLVYLAALLLFGATLLPRRLRQKFADAPAYLVPLLRAAAPWLAHHAGQLAAQAWRFCVELARWLEPRAYRLVTGRDPHARSGVMFAAREPSAAGGALPPPVRGEPPPPAAENAALHGGEPTVEREPIAPATPEELQALGRALRHNLTSADKTKSGAIKAGWGLARSGTDPRYRRASQLYDLATRPEEPAQRFPELTPDKKRAAPKAGR